VCVDVPVKRETANASLLTLHCRYERENDVTAGGSSDTEDKLTVMMRIIKNCEPIFLEIA